KVISNIKNDMLEKVFMSFRKKIVFCTNSDGAPSEKLPLEIMRIFFINKIN
ncbi:hypothetical protein ALC60_09133, partial [Trachymyrmex zeteki]